MSRTPRRRMALALLALLALLCFLFGAVRLCVPPGSGIDTDGRAEGPEPEPMVVHLVHGGERRAVDLVGGR